MSQLNHHSSGNHEPVKRITTLVTMNQLKKPVKRITTLVTMNQLNHHNPGNHEPIKETS